jgi:protein tyrosine phosphatase (PTP) superfamily phosphohydrolase (DUF442 family)
MLPFLLLPPALVAAAPAPAIPDAVQVHPRIWVLKTGLEPASVAALKAAGITHVVNLRRDGEPGFDMNGESAALTAAEITYVRLAMGRAPGRDDFDLFRAVLRDLPSGAKILVHCGNGNRAAAAACVYLVKEAGLGREEAMALAHTAGLSAPETEKALKAYLESAKG